MPWCSNVMQDVRLWLLTKLHLPYSPFMHCDTFAWQNPDVSIAVKQAYQARQFVPGLRKAKPVLSRVTQFAMAPLPAGRMPYNVSPLPELDMSKAVES